MTLFDRKTAQVLATILAFAAGLWLLWGLRELLFLIVLAVFFAYTVEPVINFIYRHTPSHISRRTSILATFLLVFLATALVGVLLGQQIATQATELIKQLPTLDEDPTATRNFPLPSQLEPFRDEVLHYGLDFARTAANTFLASLGSVGFFLLSPIFALFFLLEGPNYRHAAVSFAARSSNHIWLTGLLDDLHILLSNYIRALFLQSLSVFIGYALYYEFTRVPYSILLATLAAVLEVIPVLGWISAGLLSILVAAFSGYDHLIWMLVFYLLFRLFQDYVITPYVMQNGIELPIIAILGGVIAGEMLGGIRGMFLSIPTLATLRILYRHYLRRIAVLLILCGSLCGSLEAHSISVSTSDAQLVDSTLTLKFRIPRYEAEHVPADGLTGAIQFPGAALKSSNCQPEDSELICNLTFLYSQTPPEQIEANITLARVTVPNHVHILRITRGTDTSGPVTRQAVFDRTFENERINFHEPGRAEVWWRAARMGFTQLLYQPLLLLLLLILPRPGAFLAAALAVFFVVLPDRFYAPPGFFELATAISLSYLAFEHVLFPKASAKWVIAALIGALEGAAIAVLARPTGAGAVAFGMGHIFSAGAVSLLAWRFSRNIPVAWLRYLYWALAAVGVFWTIWVFVKRF